MATKKTRNYTIANTLGVLIVIATLFGVKAKTGSSSERVRAKQFSEYLFEKIDEYVKLGISEAEIEEFKAAYEENPALINQYINDLTKTSSEYARAIANDARLINNYGKTISFEQALKILEEGNYNIATNKKQLEQVRKTLAVAKRGKQKALD